MTEAEIDVLSANAAFYEAFASHDFGRMEAAWSAQRPLTCIHPGWSALVGRSSVMESWRAILGGDRTVIRASGARAFVAGDSAYVVCFEATGGEAPNLIATNIFVREEGRWTMVHHHAGPLASPAELLEA